MGAGSRISQSPGFNPFSSGQAQGPHHSAPTTKPDGPFKVSWTNAEISLQGPLHSSGDGGLTPCPTGFC